MLTAIKNLWRNAREKHKQNALNDKRAHANNMIRLYVEDDTIFITCNGVGVREIHKDCTAEEIVAIVKHTRQTAFKTL